MAFSSSQGISIGVLATRQDLRLTNHERLWGWTTRLLEILKK
jgi:hypothetical protein